MAARSALFRLFLASILVLNGIGSAMAAVHHAAASGVSDVTSEVHNQADPAAAGGAHGGCGEMESLLAGNDSATSGIASGAEHSSGTDCCDPGNCQGTCATSGVAALPSLIQDTASVPRQADVRTTASLRATPALPDLMRPPIA
jgi:hypothetical protein